MVAEIVAVVEWCVFETYIGVGGFAVHQLNDTTWAQALEGSRKRVRTTATAKWYSDRKWRCMEEVT